MSSTDDRRSEARGLLYDAARAAAETTHAPAEEPVGYPLVAVTGGTGRPALDGAVAPPSTVTVPADEYAGLLALLEEWRDALRLPITAAQFNLLRRTDVALAAARAAQPEVQP